MLLSLIFIIKLLLLLLFIIIIIIISIIIIIIITVAIVIIQTTSSSSQYRLRLPYKGLGFGFVALGLGQIGVASQINLLRRARHSEKGGLVPLRVRKKAAAFSRIHLASSRQAWMQMSAYLPSPTTNHTAVHPPWFKAQGTQYAGDKSELGSSY